MITRSQLSALSWAVGQAEAWRGSLTGGPDAALEEFERNIAKAKEALREAGRERKADAAAKRKEKA